MNLIHISLDLIDPRFDRDHVECLDEKNSLTPEEVLHYSRRFAPMTGRLLPAYSRPATPPPEDVGISVASLTEAERSASPLPPVTGTVLFKNFV